MHQKVVINDKRTILCEYHELFLSFRMVSNYFAAK